VPDLLAQPAGKPEVIMHRSVARMLRPTFEFWPSIPLEMGLPQQHYAERG